MERWAYNARVWTKNWEGCFVFYDALRVLHLTSTVVDIGKYLDEPLEYVSVQGKTDLAVSDGAFREKKKKTDF